MRIEDIDKVKLSKVSDKGLLVLRLRFLQVWGKNFEGNNKVVVGSLNRGDFLSKYRMLLKAYNERKLEYSTEDIDRAAFKKAMEVAKFGVDVAALGDIVVVPDYVSVVGGYVSNSAKSDGDVDIVIRESDKNRNESNELLIVRAVKKALSN